MSEVGNPYADTDISIETQNQNIASRVIPVTLAVVGRNDESRTGTIAEPPIAFSGLVRNVLTLKGMRHAQILETNRLTTPPATRLF